MSKSEVSHIEFKMTRFWRLGMMDSYRCLNYRILRKFIEDSSRIDELYVRELIKKVEILSKQIVDLRRSFIGYCFVKCNL